MTEVQLWHYLAGGQQLGPLTADQLAELAASGQIAPDTLVWTDGLEEWLPAGTVEGLFPAPAPAPAPAPQPHRPQLLVGAAAQVAHPLGSAPHSPQAVPVQAAPQQYVPGAAPVAGASYGAVPAVFMGAATPGTDYPPTRIKRASYGWFLWTLLGAILCFSGAVIALISSGIGSDQGFGLAGVLYLAGLGFAIWNAIIALVYLHRAWSCLQSAGPATTPGKAVGLLFIPFFNLYWFFVAYGAFPKDWNRTMNSYPNLQHGPRLGEGSFLAYALCLILFAPAALILSFFVYAEICKAINFMATRHLQPLGGLAHPAPGGIRLY